MIRLFLATFLNCYRSFKTFRDFALAQLRIDWLLHRQIDKLVCDSCENSFHIMLEIPSAIFFWTLFLVVLEFRWKLFRPCLKNSNGNSFSIFLAFFFKLCRSFHCEFFCNLLVPFKKTLCHSFENFLGFLRILHWKLFW